MQHCPGLRAHSPQAGARQAGSWRPRRGRERALAGLAGAIWLAVATAVEAQDSPGAPLDARSYAGLPAVRWYVINTREEAELRLYRPDGAIDPEAHATLSRLLRDHRRERIIPIDRRLLRLVFRVAYHFRAPTVRVVSGYRAATSRRHSHHRDGTALDFRLDGVPAAEVARYARYLARIGVGHYSTSDFVHLDVRDDSYYWRSRSGPGGAAGTDRWHGSAQGSVTSPGARTATSPGILLASGSRIPTRPRSRSAGSAVGSRGLGTGPTRCDTRAEPGSSCGAVAAERAGSPRPSRARAR